MFKVRRLAESNNIVFALVRDGGKYFYFVGLDDIIADTKDCYFDVDISHGWDSMRYVYEEAALYYNSLVPDSECIPAF